MWKLPAEHVGYYAEQDAELTLKLWQRFKQEIATQSLTTVWEMEQQLLPIPNKNASARSESPSGKS